MIILCSLALLSSQQQVERLPDLSIPHRIVADLSPLIEASPQGGGVDFRDSLVRGGMVVSEDGSTLFAIRASYCPAYSLKSLRRQSYESIMSFALPGKPWKLILATEGQVPYLDPSPRKLGLRSGRGVGGFASADGRTINAFAVHALPGSEGLAWDRRQNLYGFGEIFFARRGANPNPAFALPRDRSVHYLLLESRLEGGGSLRILVLRYLEGKLGDGKLQYYHFTRGGLRRLPAKELTGYERQLDGKSLSSVARRQDFRERRGGIHVDSERGVLLAKPFLYDLGTRRTLDLGLPRHSPAEHANFYWDVRLIAGRAYYSQWANGFPDGRSSTYPKRNLVGSFSGRIELPGRARTGDSSSFRSRKRTTPIGTKPMWWNFFVSGDATA